MSGLFSILIYDEQIDRLYQQNRINSDAIGPTTKLNATQLIGEPLFAYEATGTLNNNIHKQDEPLRNKVHKRYYGSQ